MVNIHRASWVVVAGLTVFALWHFSQSAYIHAKARLAQFLIQDAWAETIAKGKEVKPWWWADTWPVARMRVPRLDVELYVLAGASGRTLAFGPGHLYGTATPGAVGNSVIAAHRDTHFAFLKDLRKGDEVIVETPTQTHRRYIVSEARVVHEQDVDVLKHDRAARLTLVTCYPFEAIMPNGPLRYVVSAVDTASFAIAYARGD